MAHVVTEACVDCKYTDCVEVCPVACFHELENRLVIDPDVCIDCTACVPVCPVEAIFAEADIPADQQKYIQDNREQSPNAPVIERKKEPLAGKTSKPCKK